MGWNGGMKCLHRVREKESPGSPRIPPPASPASLEQVASPPIHRDSWGHQTQSSSASSPGMSYSQNRVFPLLPLCPPVGHSPYSSQFTRSALCSPLSSHPHPPITAKPAFAALMPSTLILTLNLFLLHQSPNQTPWVTNVILTAGLWLLLYYPPFQPDQGLSVAASYPFLWKHSLPLTSRRVTFSMLFKHHCPFSLLLVPLPLLSISLFKCWYLPCSALISAPLSSLLSGGKYRHPSSDFAYCFCSSCFFFLLS